MPGAHPNMASYNHAMRSMPPFTDLSQELELDEAYQNAVQNVLIRDMHVAMEFDDGLPELPKLPSVYSDLVQYLPVQAHLHIEQQVFGSKSRKKSSGAVEPVNAHHPVLNLPPFASPQLLPGLPASSHQPATGKLHAKDRARDSRWGPPRRGGAKDGARDSG